MASRLKCRMGKLSFLYLTLPICAKSKSKAVGILMWKTLNASCLHGRETLSLGGRITLIKATLSNLPIYYMSLLLMLMVVRERLNPIRRAFLWDGCSNKNNLHLVKWCNVIKLKCAEGLGLGNLAFKNWALLAKWWWSWG